MPEEPEEPPLQAVSRLIAAKPTATRFHNMC
jgi:hypothetical protein